MSNALDPNVTCRDITLSRLKMSQQNATKKNAGPSQSANRPPNKPAQARNQVRKRYRRKRNRQRNRPRPTGLQVGNSRLSPCAEKYVQFMHNPFDQKEVPCVPKDPATFTRRVYIHSRGSLSTGTANFGFICIDPLNACHNDQMVVDGVATGWVVYSDPAGTYAGVVTSLPGVGVLTDTGNSDYTVAAFGVGGATAAARVVGAGVRIKYRGTELSRGGSIVAFHDPQHETMINRTFAAVNGDDLRIPYSATREWQGVTWSIADNSDEMPVPDANYFGGGLPNSAADGCFPMGILIESPIGVPAIYDWEAVVGLEIQGRNIRGKRLSNADPVGHNAVSVANMIPGMNAYNSTSNTAAIAAHVARMHVGTQSAPYYPPGKPSSEGPDWEEYLEKALSFGVSKLPDLLEFGLGLL